MANKSQIKKFLENKKYEVISKLQEESKQLQESEKDKFFESYKERFEEIRRITIAVSTAYDDLLKEVVENNKGTFPNRYGAPSNYYNSLSNSLSLTELKNTYILVTEAEKVKTNYKKKVEETEREYDKLIALCGVNKAVDALKILENLGFDISVIQVKAEECTVLTTNIDAKKLFI